MGVFRQTEQKETQFLSAFLFNILIKRVNGIIIYIILIIRRILRIAIFEVYRMNKSRNTEQKEISTKKSY